MIAHEDLRTITVHTDWDLPLVDELKTLAILYLDGDWFDGDWEELETLAVEILSHFGDERHLTKELRRLYNLLVVERQKADFAFDDDGHDGDDEALRNVQQALVDELLEYHADPEMYVIVHALDEAYGDEAWFLCYLTDVEELGLDLGIQA